MVQTHYQVTSMSSILDWIERHTARLPELKQTIKDFDVNKDKEIINSFQKEINERVEHLIELKIILEESLNKINSIL